MAGAGEYLSGYGLAAVHAFPSVGQYAVSLGAAAVLSGHVRSLVGINFFLCILVGGCLGWTSAKNRAAETRFLFTRPIPRLAVLLRPLIVASFAIAIFPLATFLLLLGWLCLLPPARSQPAGLYPSPLYVLARVHFASAYLVPVFGGLCVYTLLMSPRWLTFSPKWLRSLIRFALLFFGLPFVFLVLWTPRGANPAYLQSTFLIVWLFAFAAEVLYCCWRVIDELTESDHSSVEEAIRAAREAK